MFFLVQFGVALPPARREASEGIQLTAPSVIQRRRCSGCSQPGGKHHESDRKMISARTQKLKAS